MPKETVKKTVKKAVPKRATTKTVKIPVTHDDIAMRAYFLSLESSSDPLDNWLRAERELVPV